MAPIRFYFAAMAVPLIVAALLLPDTAQAQTGSTLRGRVIARGTGEPIEDARVDLNGRASMLTDSDGAFRFSSVPPGRVTLYVEAFGYADAELTFDVHRDTTVAIKLVDAPIPVDSLVIMARRISVRGRVIDATKRLAVDARVLIAPGDESTMTSGTGRYGFDDVLVGEGSFVSVEAFGYLPVRAYLTTLNDTTVDFVLEPDPVAQRMIDRELNRLATRSDTSVPYPIERIRRDDWYDDGSIAHVLDSQFQLARAKCVIIDEVKAAWPRHQLRAIPSDDVHFIEIIDRWPAAQPGAEMVRIYTEDFIRRMVTERAKLGKVIVYRQGRPELCR